MKRIIALILTFALVITLSAVFTGCTKNVFIFSTRFKQSETFLISANTSSTSFLSDC